ncbi:hypothetical protein WG66_011086 [Moniliophthora roreri]|uniref:Uncharacterized protein n=1 Tax=Moniliophthora roreri TaxID=221103 RepID=A0A0W0FLA7_MONRR|nr:hypothetical protein WG66_011086 [Moniliophthora roreri]
MVTATAAGAAVPSFDNPRLSPPSSTSSSSTEILPDFIQQFSPTVPSQPSPPHLTPEQLSSFTNAVQTAQSNTSFTSMHVSPADIAPFMEHMESLDPAAAFPAAAVPAAYMSVDPVFPAAVPSTIEQAMAIELPPSNGSSSVSSPLPPQIPSPSIHGSASSYGVGVTSSLQSALDPAAVSAPRSRSGTISSPNTIMGASSLAPGSAPNPDSSGIAFPIVLDMAVKKEESPLSIGGSILEEIVKSASAAASLCKAGKGAEASRIVENLGEKLAYVSDVISGLSDLTMSENKAPPAFPEMSGGSPEFYPPPGTSLVPIPETTPLIFPAGNTPTSDIDISPIIPVPTTTTPPDSTRKRCASEIEAERPIKALKSEPQDESLYPLQTATNPHIHALQSPPPSRPPTPPRNFVFNPVKSQQQPIANYQAYGATSAPPLDLAPTPIFPTLRSSWSESVVPTRHSHSLSTGSINVTGNRANLGHGFAKPPVNGRMTRSGSIGAHPFTYSYPQPHTQQAAWSNVNSNADGERGANGLHAANGDTSLITSPAKSWEGTSRSSPGEDDGDDADDGDEDSPRSGGTHSTSGSVDVPQEYRQEVDRIFFEFLNRICSNLDATDSKGDPIHQTLMPKKMQRLDESPDFRPFKFRILAFTTAFLEEACYPEEKIPMKKIRNYLWRHPYIQRFNEDGKKAKSKGNYIWNVEAKKLGDGRWEFRPFQRKLAGTPPGVAYCGLRWHWTPHIWDPQASFTNVPVHYSSPSLPSWLSWKGEELSGTPPPDAQSCDITVHAKFILDGQEGHLSTTFHLNIAPRSAVDPTYTLPRSQSDTLLHQAPLRAVGRTTVNPTENAPARVVEVLQNVAQRVTEEAATQPRSPGDLQDLVKQKQAVEQSLVAYDRALTGPTPPETHRLAVAAQAVVAEAAQSAVARVTAAAGVVSTPILAIQAASVGEMADLTQEALAAAVKMQGTASNNIEVIETTCSLLASRNSTHDTRPVPTMNGVTMTPPRGAMAPPNSYPFQPVSNYV